MSVRERERERETEADCAKETKTGSRQWPFAIKKTTKNEMSVKERKSSLN